jgi:hypothetical protein
MKNLFLLIASTLFGLSAVAQTPFDNKAEARLTGAPDQHPTLAYHQPASDQRTEASNASQKTASTSQVSQSYVFGDTKAKIKVTLQRSDDSLTLKVEFANQSKSSFFIDAVKPISYKWSANGSELLVEYGSDGTKESGFPVTQIKGGETNDLVISLPRKTNKFKMNLLVAYFESTSSAPQTILSSKGNWKWSEYKVPVLLKN